MFVLITSDMNSNDIAFNDAELYDTVQDARDWVEISQGYDLEAGDLQKYSIFAVTEVSADSDQTNGFFVKSGAEMLVYDSFEEIVERYNDEIEFEDRMLEDRIETFGAEYANAMTAENKESIKLYRLADEATQIITEVIDEELLAA
jgi:hypothetical protein